MDKCDICQREAEKVTVYADPDFPSSSAYCEECILECAFFKSIQVARAQIHHGNSTTPNYPLVYFEDGKYKDAWPHKEDND